MFESKHCNNCFYACKSRIRYNDSFRWCTLKEHEVTISGTCCHYQKVERDDGGQSGKR